MGMLIWSQGQEENKRWRRCREFSVSSDCMSGFVSLFECQRDGKEKAGVTFALKVMYASWWCAGKLVYQALVHHSYLVISQHI